MKLWTTIRELFEHEPIILDISSTHYDMSKDSYWNTIQTADGEFNNKYRKLIKERKE